MTRLMVSLPENLFVCFGQLFRRLVRITSAKFNYGKCGLLPSDASKFQVPFILVKIPHKPYCPLRLIVLVNMWVDFYRAAVCLFV